MFERNVSVANNREVLRSGEVVENYPDRKPFPRQLYLGYVNGRPLHVVIAFDTAVHTIAVVTVYDPNVARWSDEFRTRRP